VARERRSRRWIPTPSSPEGGSPWGAPVGRCRLLGFLETVDEFVCLGGGLRYLIVILATCPLIGSDLGLFNRLVDLVLVLDGRILGLARETFEFVCDSHIASRGCCCHR
jgi:hypothetical protein